MPHFTPTVVLYEVYKLVRQEFDEEKAIRSCAYITGNTTVVPLDEMLAVEAANVGLQHGLSMADAIVKATADLFGAKVVTSDEHLGKLKGVQLIR